MPRLHLVRHAKPAAGWGEEPDPGLDSIGHEQARATAQRLKESLGPLPVYTSPMRRCQETAAPLAQLWRCMPHILAPVAEIPSPPLDPALRREWLGAAMRGTWASLHATAPAGSIDYLDWRRTLLEALAALSHDCVVYTHYIAINVAVGAAQGRDDVLCFRPDHASVTVFETNGDRLQLLELGREATTLVLTGQ